jgi:mannitol operon transcriptional antiterminator
MALDQRSCSILNHLVHADGYVTIPFLTETFRVSRRTIYYDLDKIDDWLKERGYSPLKKIRNAGVYLEEKEKRKIQEDIKTLNERDYEYTTKERQAWIILHLMTTDRPVFIDDLAQLFRVSRNTIIEDIKILKNRLDGFQVALLSDRRKGYLIEGDEKSCRKAMVYYLSVIFPEHAWSVLEMNKQKLFRHEGAMVFPSLHPRVFDDLVHFIQRCETQFELEYTDDVHRQLAIRLIFILRRIQLDRVVRFDPIEKDVLSDTPEKALAQRLMEHLAHVYRLDIPDDEIYYLATHFLGARVNDLRVQETDSRDIKKLAVIIKKMIDDFEKLALVQFQDREQMERNMLIHLKSAYYRLIYDIQMINPVAEQVIEHYPEIYHLTEKVIHHLEAVVQKPVPENEIAFMALHFGGWLRREGLRVRKKSKVLVVCANGVGTSRMLQQQLEEWFPSIEIIRTATTRNYHQYKHQADFIISTTPLADGDPSVPIMTVSPILTEAQLLELQKKLALKTEAPRRRHLSVETILEIVEQHATIADRSGLYQALQGYLHQPEIVGMYREKPGLADLLSSDTVQIKDSVANWEAAIRIAAEPLLLKQAIEDRYVDAMLQNVQTMGPYMVIAPRVAVPHARPEDGVRELGLSVLKLRQAIPFPDEHHLVQLIVVLAATDDERHLKALSQLSRLLSRKEGFQALLASQNEQELLALLRPTGIKHG